MSWFYHINNVCNILVETIRAALNMDVDYIYRLKIYLKNKLPSSDTRLFLCEAKFNILFVCFGLTYHNDGSSIAV